MADPPRPKRDRDELGRPRQARPRDSLGRPLPYGSEGVQPVPEDALPPQAALDLARKLACEGRYFAAHEVLEARWKAGPPQERRLWQGLAQLCVALTHAARGNQAGATRLLDRATTNLADYEASAGPTHGVDLTAASLWARQAVSDMSGER